MTSIKINTKIQIILLVIIVTSSILLLQQSLNTSDRTNKINMYSKQLNINNKISADINHLTASGQKYILYSDKQYLDAFRYYSKKTIEDEHELYNIANPINKQTIADIIELTKAYISFVENEVFPTIRSGTGIDTGNYKYLLLRHNELDQELQQKAAAVTAANMEDANNYFQVTVTGINKKVTLLVIFLLSALVLLLWGIYTTLTSLSVQYLYFDKLSERINSAVILVDNKGYFKQLNKTAGELLGISPDKILENSISDVPVLFPQLQGITEPLYAVIMEKKELLNYNLTYSYADQKLDLTVDYIPIIIFKKITGVMIIASLVEEDKNKNILLDTLEAERKRISIEIHDWIARYLSTIIHSIDYILRLKGEKKEQLEDNLLALRSHCQNAAIEMRSFMNNIHPYLIDKVGLVSALESYINIFEKLNNIKVYVFYQSRSLNIPSKNEIIIYRIIQEALSNIAKHSKATEVDIHFTILHNRLTIEVKDNGGNTGEYVSGKGMWGMKERAKLVGGDIKFENTSSGFCVTLTVPITQGGQQNGENQSNAD
ncbi:signal transduction histidine kinase [Desulfohalotomaculum tongense]|uniref:sensor histidine kinase n=1 Tax=Desulforadius tongensis TaxID=1216062 RepID=UPI001959F0B5|nr:ATP-binding protein [Desulforadius tongensis]MBM7854870.1 signal transduction histidine kinase [Desulforadius tongensis]